MTRFRTIELYPNGQPPTKHRMVGISGAVTHLSNVFKQCMLQEDTFRSEGIRIERLAPAYAQFQRIGQTAGFGCWTRYQPTDAIDTVRRGFDAFTLLLSGVSKDADDQVIRMFSDLVTAPVMKTPEFNTQDYGIPAGFVDRVIAERRPVGINIYIRPDVVEQTGIASATAAMVGAFFTLLGVEHEGD